MLGLHHSLLLAPPQLITGLNHRALQPTQEFAVAEARRTFEAELAAKADLRRKAEVAAAAQQMRAKLEQEAAEAEQQRQAAIEAARSAMEAEVVAAKQAAVAKATADQRHRVVVFDQRHCIISGHKFVTGHSRRHI